MQFFDANLGQIRNQIKERYIRTIYIQYNHARAHHRNTGVPYSSNVLLHADVDNGICGQWLIMVAVDSCA